MGKLTINEAFSKLIKSLKDYINNEDKKMLTTMESNNNAITLEQEKLATEQAKLSEEQIAQKELIQILQSKHKKYEYINIPVDGWYRIAETELSVYTYNNLLQMYASRNGRSNSAIFSTSGAFSTEPEITPIVFTNYNTSTIDQIRIVYPKAYTGKHAYLEVCITGATTAKPVSFQIEEIINTGWNFYDALQTVTSINTEEYNIKTTSLTVDVDFISEQVSSKLNQYDNTGGSTNRAYVALKNGKQSTYAISTGSSSNSIMMRNDSGTAEVAMTDSPTRKEIANVEYVNNYLQNMERWDQVSTWQINWNFEDTPDSDTGNKEVAIHIELELEPDLPQPAALKLVFLTEDGDTNYNLAEFRCLAIKSGGWHRILIKTTSNYGEQFHYGTHGWINENEQLTLPIDAYFGLSLYVRADLYSSGFTSAKIKNITMSSQ